MLFRTIFYLIFLGLFTGCTHYNYSPNLVPTPFNVEKNEATFAANLGGILNGHTVDVQAAYNPLKRVTLMANYFQGSSEFNESISVSEKNKYRLNYVEAAAGAWQPLFGEPVYVGCFLGFGSAMVKNDYGFSRRSKLRFNKTFLQPTIMYKGDWLRFGFGTRFAHMAYKSGDIDNGIAPEELEILRQIERDSPFNFLEIGFNIGLDLGAGITWTSSVVRSDLIGSKKVENTYQLNNTYQFDPLNISAGLSFDIHRLFKKKTAKKPLAPAAE